MPVVILSATEVDDAAAKALAAMRPPPGQVILAGGREIQALEEVQACAQWLSNMKVKGGKIGLTLQEAQLIEPFLPDPPQG